MRTELALGLQNYAASIAELQESYLEVANYANAFASKTVRIEDAALFRKAISCFGPQLKIKNDQLSLQKLYEIGFHKNTGAVVVASQGVNLYSKTYRYTTPYTIRYITAAVYMPQLGVEIANIGIVGDVYHRPFVLRSESACSPSFLFGSQSCNCAFQWRCTHELAGALNPVVAPNENFEKWLASAFTFNNGKHIPTTPGIGFLMIHLDTQNGMGCGYTPNVFSMDLSTRSILRHGGGLVAGQAMNLSIKETFEGMELPLDPRRAENHVGYKIGPIIMDFLGVNSQPVMLSNNPQKIQALESFGYTPQRLKALGETNLAGLKEAKQRNQDLGHLDIGSELSSFHQEFSRLKTQIERTFNIAETVEARLQDIGEVQC